jgi:hypothetical protein
MVDLHLWLMNYLDCKLGARSTNPHLRTLIKVFYKLCKKDFKIQRPLTRTERRWLSLTFRSQVTK